MQYGTNIGHMSKRAVPRAAFLFVYATEFDEYRILNVLFRRLTKMSIAYEKDVVAWANEQAGFIRAGRFDLLDLENIAEEIEDVGKSEQRELESRMAVLLAHLLKWQFQPERRGASWAVTIRTQRDRSNLRLRKTPSLKYSLADTDWMSDVWADAVDQAAKDTNLDIFPLSCPWDMADVLKDGWLPT
jgi:hypothetical protein